MLHVKKRVLGPLAMTFQLLILCPAIRRRRRNHPEGSARGFSMLRFLRRMVSWIGWVDWRSDYTCLGERWYFFLFTVLQVGRWVKSSLPGAGGIDEAVNAGYPSYILAKYQALFDDGSCSTENGDCCQCGDDGTTCALV